MDVSPDFPANGSSTPSDKLAAAVRLPFSMVPGMDFSSKSYQKALITLGKQKVGTSSKKSLVMSTDRGMFPDFSFYGNDDSPYFRLMSGSSRG